MTFLRNILFLGILLTTIFVFVTTMGADPCTDQAKVFLAKLSEGDIETLLPQFGENTCHCQPRGGYRAYIRYESGEADNLAFLFGHKFKTGEMTFKNVPTIEKVKTPHMIWEEPESTEVDVPLSFDPSEYSPYFLPLDMAYGHSVSESDFKKFCADPSPDFWKCLALRLRPGLEKGLVPRAKPDSKAEFMADLFEGLLPEEQARYLKPKDAAKIEMSDGSEKDAADFAKSFPRLKQGILRLYIVRRGQFHRWTIRKGRLKDPVFLLSDGKEIATKTPEAALQDQPGHGAQIESGNEQ
ncbi:MAG: hypothetical protein K2X27_09180 [Candidatus Obscuribacterales bacterium]|nr:hypothetical protein [Candidatus Obscuribacterales bacterium]